MLKNTSSLSSKMVLSMLQRSQQRFTSATPLFINNNTHRLSLQSSNLFFNTTLNRNYSTREYRDKRDNNNNHNREKELREREREQREKQQHYNRSLQDKYNNNNGYVNTIVEKEIDLDGEIHKCSTFCLAKSFRKELHSLPEGFSLEKVFPTSNVKWLRYNGESDLDSVDSDNNSSQPVSGSDVFIFPSFGCVVSWGVPEHAQRRLLDWLQEYKVNAHPDQVDIYRYTDSGNRFEITKNQEMVSLSSDSADNFNEKFAVSYAFAQSVRLFLIEDDVMKLSEKVALLPEELSQKGTVEISKKEIVKQLGEQMKIKNYLNLHSDIIDTPEHFWEHTEGEGIYKIVRSHCEIDKRVRIMNERLNLISGIYDVINDEQKHSHSIRLERIIIALIAIEGTSGILHWFY